MTMPAIDHAAVPLAPVIEEVRIIGITPGDGGRVRVSAAVTVDARNPVFAGHFPGLPVFPGVCQLECANRTVLAAARRTGVWPTLETIVTARFSSMVSPSDTLAIDTLITEVGRRWTVISVLTARRRRTAKFVLRYRLRG